MNEKDVMVLLLDHTKKVASQLALVQIVLNSMKEGLPAEISRFRLALVDKALKDLAESTEALLKQIPDDPVELDVVLTSDNDALMKTIIANAVDAAKQIGISTTELDRELDAQEIMKRDKANFERLHTRDDPYRPFV